MKGDRIGPYRVLRGLGSGGMGEVVLARVEEEARGLCVGDRVALKIVHSHLHGDPAHEKRFVREAQIGRAVQHENVGRFLDAGPMLHRDQERYVLVMEYVPGQTLRGLLEEMGTVPEQLCLHIAHEVAKGLEAIHRAGVVHRDLKPENVLITPKHVVKLVDFGVARIVDATMHLSHTGTFVGSVDYAAPEQFTGRHTDVDGRADLHALGVLLYEISTGRHPFRSGDPRRTLHAVLHKTPRRLGALNPQLSPFFEEIVATLLAKDRDLRFADTGELLGVLEAGDQSSWWRHRSQTMRTSTGSTPRDMRVPRETGLYGRDEELTALAQLQREVEDGEGRVLLLEGETGIGKTRLVDEFVRGLREGGEDVHFLFGGYVPGGAAATSGALAAAYRRYFGEQELEEALHDVLPGMPALVPAFAAVLRGEPSPVGAPRLTSQSLATLFVRTTQALAADRPTIVLIEDLHFAPEESRAVFLALAQAIADSRVFLIGTFRPGVPAAWTGQVERMTHAHRRVLARLGARDLVELLADAFHSEVLAEELAGRIALKSDGNPFFVFEIVRALREEGLIHRGADGAWVITDVLPDVYVPSSVTDLVQARLGELDREDRELLELASCCGFEFDPLVVTRAAAVERLPALKRFGNVERRHRLIHSLGARMTFDHHQVQEALYTGMIAPLREEYHRALGEAYEAEAVRKDAPRGEAHHAVEIAEHFVAARDVARALPYLPRALATLDGSFLHERAIALVRAALDAPGLLEGETRFRHLIDLVHRLDYRGAREEQEACLREIRALADRIGGARTAYEAQSEEGYYRFTLGRYEEARASYEAALALARSPRDRKAEADTIRMLGAIAQQTGQHDLMSRHYQAWLEIAEELGHRSAIASATGAMGNVCLLQGRYEEAAVLFERYRELAVEEASLTAEGIATGNLSSALRYLGRYGEALGHARRRLDLARASGDRRAEGIALMNLGAALTSLGDHPEARRHFKRALRVCEEIGASREEGTALHGMGGLAAEEGRYDEAEQLLHRALDRRRQHGDRYGTASVLLTLGRALAEAGKRADATRCLADGESLAAEYDLPDVLVLGSGIRAALLGGDTVQAARAWRAHRSRLIFADRLEACFRLWQATGKAEYLAEARRMLDQLVEGSPPEYRAVLQSARPLCRAVVAAQQVH